MRTPPTRASLLVPFLLGVAATGCSGEIGTGGPGAGSDGGLDGSGAGQVANQLVCQQLSSRSLEIPTKQPGIGLGNANVEVAADRLVLLLTSEAAAEPDALAARLAAADLCLVRLDAEHRRAIVRYDAARGLGEVLGQLATITGVRDSRLDPVMRGAKDDGKGKDDGGKDGGDEGEGSKKKNKKSKQGEGGDGKKDGYKGASLWHLAALRMGPAFALQPSAAPEVIALLDTGIDKTTPGLEKVNLLPGYDFVNGDADPTDDNGHGTLLAGIIASKGEFPGVAPNAAILPIKVLDQTRLGTESALVAGIDYAVAHGAKVISMSLAFPDGFVPSFDLSRAVRDARAAGAVLVAAAGNTGDNEIAYPAAFGEVIAVGAGRMAFKTKVYSLADALKVDGEEVAKKLRRADYSQYGAAIDVLAPGGSMVNDLDGDGHPDAIPAYSFSPNDPSKHEAFLISGTSPAAAQAAGITALLLAEGAKPNDVLPLFLRGATSLPPVGFDVDSGAGVLNAGRSLFLQKKKLIPQVPARFVNPVVTLANDPQGFRHAMAFVELIDDKNKPVAGSTILGHFRGAVKHDVSAVTDAQGRALLVSLKAPPGSMVFEFGVDKVIETAKKDWSDDEDDDNENVQTIIIPKEFSRFEKATFRFLSAFRPTGQGPEPTPFMILTPASTLTPLIGSFSGGMKKGPEPTPFHEPVATIPTDVNNYTIVPSLAARSFGPAAGGAAPVVMAFDRAVLDSDCGVAQAGIPIASTGSGLAPSPTRIAQSLTSDQLTSSQVVLRSTDMFLNDGQVTAADLGLLFGAQGTVLVSVDGSICVPQGYTFTDTGLMKSSSVSAGGFSVAVDPNAPPPPSNSGAFPVGDTALGAGNGQAPFATNAAVKASAQVEKP